MVADGDVPSQRDVVGERHRVADLTIMGDVACHHQEAAFADARDAAAGFGAGVDGDVLAHM